MDEKSNKKQNNSKKKKRRRSRSSSDSEKSGSDEWVERKIEKKSNTSRDDWMSLGGTLKTFTKDDIRPKREEKDKKNIDSYNPATSSRELNPYWKNGGTGVPQTSEQYRKTNQFIKPKNDDHYYSKNSSNSYNKFSDSRYKKSSHDLIEKSDNKSSRRERDEAHNRSYNWRKSDKSTKYETPINLDNSDVVKEKNDAETHYSSYNCRNSNDSKKYETPVNVEKSDVIKYKSDINNSEAKKSLFLSDEKMNKLAAKIVKAEILGDTKLVEELKLKLQAAKDFRKQNPNYEKLQNVNEKESVLLIRTTPAGSSQPLMDYGENVNKKGKNKTHNSSGRINYYANDDKYNIKTMFEQEKYGTNHRNDAQLAATASKCKDLDNLEDLFEQHISQKKQVHQESKHEEKYAIKQHLKMEKSQEFCKYCFDSKNMLKHLIISCGNKVYMALPSKKSLVEGHCIITTIHHNLCTTAVDEDIWEEIMTYRNMITQYFNTQNKDVIFFETAIKLFKYPHMVINCVPLPRDVGDMASIYFKKALLECESEWSMNKKVIELKGKNIRKGVPKGLPYFWVDFGMDPGFAHVIEDHNQFPETFAQQIIGGMLDLDHHLWKNPQLEIGEAQRKKVVAFLKEWKPFEDMFKCDTKR